MTLMSLLSYLFGSRTSVIAVAHCRHAVWLGLLFVLSAGLAREYDGESLVHEPWHVALPLIASLLTSLLLFGLANAAFASKHTEPTAISGMRPRYRAFLGLYWMTAPLAWLYAIPVERWLEAADAVRANLSLLALVSLWRVVLITRVVAVLYARSMLASFFVVMLFADTVAMAVVWLTPLPILSIMGGIRLSESEQLIQAAGFWVRAVGTITWPAWLIGAVVAATRSRSAAIPWREVSARGSRTEASWPLWALAATSLLIWLPILPSTQREQRNRRHVEIALRHGRLAEAIQYMSQRRPGDFPPHWDPPPRIGYGEHTPFLVDVLLLVERPGIAAWVKELFRGKLAVQSQSAGWDYHGHAIQLEAMSDEQLEDYVRILRGMPNGRALARYHEHEMEATLAEADGGSSTAPLSPARREALEAIRQMTLD